MPSSIVVSAAIFLVIPLALLLVQRCSGADAAADSSSSITAYELQSHNCSSSSGNLSSVYAMNLGHFLATLPSNVISNGGFFSGSVGSTDAVFGMAMCHADIAWPDQCESCLQAATADAPTACPSSYNASVAYRGCVLLYWDAPPAVVPDSASGNIFSHLVFYTTQDHAAVGRVPDTTALAQTRTDLFRNLTTQVVASPLMVASGNLPFNSTHNLYGLAQCNRDLPKNLCSFYILVLFRVLPQLVSDAAQSSEELSITAYGYYVRYDLTRFQVYVPDNSSGPTTETPKGN